MKKLIGAVILALTVALAGCSQGGGNCGGILQYCEPEETTQAPQDPGGGAVPPGGGQIGGSGTEIGEVAMVADLRNTDDTASLGIGVSITVAHTLASQDDIPTVEDPYTHLQEPSPHSFDALATPVAYIFKVKSDTTLAKFTVVAVAPLGSLLRCEMVDMQGAPLSGGTSMARRVTQEIGGGRGRVQVECVYAPPVR